MLHCTVNVNVDGLTERPILRISRSTISQVDNPGVVTEELSTIFCDFPRNSVGILDVSLAEVFEHATEKTRCGTHQLFPCPGNAD